MKKQTRVMAALMAAMLAAALFCASAAAADEPADPVFSEEAGFYDAKSLLLSLSAPEGYRVYYTTDGSVPTEDAQLAGEPIRLRAPGIRADDLSARASARRQYYDPGEVFAQNAYLPTAAVVRAVAVAPDGTHGRVVTKSYFFGAGLREKYADVAVFSIATDDRNLLDEETGIFVLGRKFAEWRETPEGKAVIREKRWWDLVANFSQHGKEWERPASMELFDGAAGAYRQTDTGIRVHGGASRNAPQKSLTLHFRKEYGEGHFEYALIPGAKDAEGGTIGTYKSFMLRNGGNAHLEVKFRDALFQTCMEGMDFARQASREAVLFINGEYWGSFTLCEKFSQSYLETHYPGIDGHNTVIVQDGEIDDGVPEDIALYEELMTFAEEDLSDPDAWRRFCLAVDTDSMAEYFAAEIYIGNADWRPGKNVRLWRTREPHGANAYDDGRWRYLMYDTEYAATLYGEKTTDVHFDSFSATLALHPLFAAAMRSPEFQARFLTALREAADVYFAPERVNALLEEYDARYRPFLEDDGRRFGVSRGTWNRDLTHIREFFAVRRGYILEHALAGIRRLTAGENAPSAPAE